MIKANELRIGNWVDTTNTHHEDQFGQVGEIGKDLLGIIREGHSSLNGVALFTVNPIPLTPEILETCGFVFETNGDCNFENFILSKSKPDRFTVFLTGDEVHFDRPLLDVKYVHQVQNLFFTLNGKELLIKFT